MICKLNFKKWMVYVPLIMALCFLAGCAVKTAPVWGDPQTGLILTYRMSEDMVLKYKRTADQYESVDVMGQLQESQSGSTTEFTLRLKERKEDNLHFLVTIDSMVINVDSPQGLISPDMSMVNGKSFSLTISPLGKELELSSEEPIEYELGPSGSRDAVQGFQAIMPDFVDTPVNVGDTWKTEDTVKQETENTDITVYLKMEHTLDGFETVNELECARIKTKITGSLEGEGEQQGMPLYFEGDIDGTDTWYFAYKKGVFVKMVSDSSLDGVINMTGPQSYTFPLTQESKSEIKLIK